MPRIDIPRFASSSERQDGHRSPRPAAAANEQRAAHPPTGGRGTPLPANATQPLERSVYEGLAGFRYALRQFISFSEAASVAAGITSQQYQALLVIKASPDEAIMVRELAEQMMLQPHGAVQLTDRLVGAGLAERRPSPRDRRSVLITITPAGEELLARLAADHVIELSRREALLAESLRRLRSVAR